MPGRAVLLVGASSTIGRAIGRRFAADGDRVAGVSLEPLAEAEPAFAAHLAADCSTSEGADDAVSAAVDLLGGLNVVVVNKDSTQNLQLSLTTGLSVNTAELLLLTGPALDATSGVMIQGAAVTPDGGFAPAAPYTPTTAAGVVSCYVPAASAALIRIN